MKTIKLNSKQMILASFLALIILGGNVNAKGTETGFASSLENIVEPELTVEDWMITDNYWYIANKSFDYQESDKILNLESWMTDENYWKPSVVKFMETVEEAELKIDGWMLNETVWNTQK